MAAHGSSGRLHASGRADPRPHVLRRAVVRKQALRPRLASESCLPERRTGGSADRSFLPSSALPEVRRRAAEAGVGHAQGALSFVPEGVPRQEEGRAAGPRAEGGERGWLRRKRKPAKVPGLANPTEMVHRLKEPIPTVVVWGAQIAAAASLAYDAFISGRPVHLPRHRDPAERPLGDVPDRDRAADLLDHRRTHPRPTLRLADSFRVGELKLCSGSRAWKRRHTREARGRDAQGDGCGSPPGAGSRLEAGSARSGTTR
jgi:hypothetical protein